VAISVDEISTINASLSPFNFPTPSRSRIQTLIREQYILVGGEPAKPRDAVKTGDLITIALPEAVPLEAAPQDIPLDVMFEDEHLLVLNKAPGMVVHPHRGANHLKAVRQTPVPLEMQQGICVAVCRDVCRLAVHPVGDALGDNALAIGCAARPLDL
jgi:23S rRNA-/tRNA-specific pseudouridylate synthase